MNKPEKITDFHWLNLFRSTWENNGQSGEWIFASRRDNPFRGKDIPDTDAVVIVPIHVQTNPSNQETRKLVVCREYRTSIGDYEYSFPAGLKVPNEAVIDCASRELLEETGLKLTVLKRISPLLYTSSGLSDESVKIVITECTGQVSKEKLEPSEDITVQLLELDEINKLCVNYKVKQSAKLWPILLMFSLMGTLAIK